MSFYSWILGLSRACAFGIVSAMWFASREGAEGEPKGLDNAVGHS